MSKGSGLSSELKDLFIAAMQNDVPALKAGLEHFDVNVTDENGQILLHFAAGHLAYGAVDFLLEQDGIDPTIQDSLNATQDKLNATAAFMPMQVYQGHEPGNRMFKKLMPCCHPGNPEDDYDIHDQKTIMIFLTERRL